MSLKSKRKPIIHLYSICWNEEYMLKYFFKHYDPWVDRYVFFDDASTDQTLNILRQHPEVKVRKFERLNTDSYVLAAQQVHNNVWKESRGQADWVIISPVDEFLYMPELMDYLADCKRRGITAIPALGYQMISQTLPSGEQSMLEMVTRGYPWDKMNKLSIFDPNKIAETNYQIGRHSAHPTGKVTYPETDKVLNLHYKYLSFEHTFNRNVSLNEKLGLTDKQNKWADKYSWTKAELKNDWDSFETRSLENILLSQYNHHLNHSTLAERWWRKKVVQSKTKKTKIGDRIPQVLKKTMTFIRNFLYLSTHWRDYKRIQEFSLFNKIWYLENNPDVKATGINPSSHYLRFGRFEGRLPLPAFPNTITRKKGKKYNNRGRAIFILGAAKAGTGTLFNLLNSFSEFDGAAGKEPRFFSMDHYYNKGFEWYQSRYGRSSSRFQLEATPHYIYFPIVPQRVRSYGDYFKKDMKFIVLLREPVSRCYSAWNMLRSFHANNPSKIIDKHYKFYNQDIRKSLSSLLRSKEFPSFHKSVMEDIELQKNHSSLLEPSYVRKGIYSRQISHWLDFFDMGDFLFLEMRELHDPQLILEKIQNFLDIAPPLYFQTSAPVHINAGAYQAASEEDQHVFSLLGKYYWEYNEELFKLIGRRYDWNDKGKGIELPGSS